MQPVNVENNAVFIVDLGKLKTVKDLYCDDMGSWQYNGVYQTWLEVDENGFISTLGKNKPLQPAPDTYYITKKYFVHKSCGDLRKIVAVLSGEYTCTCTLLFFFLGILVRSWGGVWSFPIRQRGEAKVERRCAWSKGARRKL